jgi:HEPN domain-containing protein
LENKYLEKGDSQVIDCAKALIKHKLGINYSDCEEYIEAEKYLKEALELLDKLSDFLKIRFFNTI